MERFADRREAGKQLAARLGEYTGQAVVLALPRGGVETGVEVARELGVPLGLVIARKIGHPMMPEYAVCAVTETGPVVCNEAERAALDPHWLRGAEAAERAEAARRRKAYAIAPSLSLQDEAVILVDDGIATGLTMRAAAAEVLAGRPRRLIVAVPAAPRDAVDELGQLADEVIVLADPDAYLGAVGAYYASFPQLSDREVIKLLSQADNMP